MPPYVLTLILLSRVLTMLCPILIAAFFLLPYFASQEVDLFMHHPPFLFLSFFF
jgi:hypothetical protein